jgi:hypothetical protein
MSSSSLIRWGAVGALLAGFAWIVSGYFFYVWPGEGEALDGSLAWYLMESADGIAELGMLAALLSLHVQQRSYYGRLGMAGFTIAFVGTTFVLLSTLIWMLVGGADNFFVGLFFTLGLFVGWPIGFTLLGIATFRAKVFPRWCGVLLIAFFPILFVIFSVYDTAVIWNGVVWLALCYALWPQGGRLQAFAQ